MRQAIQFITCAVFSGNLMFGSQPNPSNFHIRSPLTNRIVIKSGAQAQATLDSLVSAHPQLAAGGPYAFSITNASGNPVMALTIRWKWTDAEGRDHIYDQRTDSYFMTRANVLNANQTVVVMPGFFAAQRPIGFGMSGFGPVETNVHEFEGASTVEAIVDCVLFSDGELLGSDESVTYEELKIRYKTSKEVADIVLGAIATNQSVADAVTKYRKAAVELSLANPQAINRSAYMWRERIIRPFMNTAAPQASIRTMARRLKAVPELPARRRTMKGGN